MIFCKATLTSKGILIDNIEKCTDWRWKSEKNKIVLKPITPKLLDENGNELVSAKGIINEIEKGKTQEHAISITSNYINACWYEIVEN